MEIHGLRAEERGRGGTQGEKYETGTHRCAKVPPEMTALSQKRAAQSGGNTEVLNSVERSLRGHDAVRTTSKKKSFYVVN